MNRPYSNKYAQAGAYVLAITLFGFGIYTGLTMADPGTGSFAGINFSPKQVTFAGLSLGTIWVVIRSLAGSNFKDYEMPKPIIILWCVLLFEVH